jgi:tetratricopeptide (TPR) repeat protein
MNLLKKIWSQRKKENNDKQSRIWYLNARKLEELQQYTRAIIAYEKAINFRPNYYEAWHFRGILFARLGRMEEALVSLEKAIELQPKEAILWQEKAEILDKENKIESAISAYQTYIKLKPQDADAWYCKGCIWEKINEYSEALLAYEQAIELRSDLYQGMSAREVAVKKNTSTEIIKLNSKFPEAWYRRGLILKQMSCYVEAIASFDKVIQIQPDNIEAWYEKARCYALQDNPFLAVQNLKKVLKLKSSWAEIIEKEKDFDSIRQADSFRQLLALDN